MKTKVNQIYKTEFKAVDSGEMQISGYASVFNVIDSYYDAIAPGAFAKTIMENRNRIKLCYQHSLSCPIGKITELKEDNKGLFFSAKLANTTMGTDCYNLVKDGILDEISIGFQSIKDEFVNDVRVIREAKLWEISIVTLAANEYAKITDVKKDEFLLKKVYKLQNDFDILKSRFDALVSHQADNPLGARQEPQNNDNNPIVNQLLDMIKKCR